MKMSQHSTPNTPPPVETGSRQHWSFHAGRWLLAAPRFILIFAVRIYRLILSPAQTFLFGPTGGCRFTPTCSAYAMDALREHGAVAGTVLAAKRICRCHPWGGCGHDPVPKSGKRKTDSGDVFHPAHS